MMCSVSLRPEEAAKWQALAHGAAVYVAQSHLDLEVPGEPASSASEIVRSPWAHLPVVEQARLTFDDLEGQPIGRLYRFKENSRKAICKPHKCVCWLSCWDRTREAETELVQWLLDHKCGQKTHLAKSEALKLKFGMKPKGGV